MIAIVDSGIANLGSVAAAFRRIGFASTITMDAMAIGDARALVLPGVGAFGDAMARLRNNGLVEPIRAAAANGTPILGICLGMQLLADESEEFGRHQGLGLIRGRVVRLQSSVMNERVPNIGWCDVTRTRPSALYRGIANGTPFYFVHSYHLVCGESADAVAVMPFGGTSVTVGIERGNVFGAQFHPEKSQDAGLEVLSAFAAHAVGSRNRAA